MSGRESNRLGQIQKKRDASVKGGKQMGRYMKFGLVDEAATALEQIAKMTKRTPIEVISDALRTYEWLLQEQTVGRKIVSMNGDPDEESGADPLSRERTK